MESKSPLCPECGGDTAWEWQDRYQVGSVGLVERSLICLDRMCWTGPAVLFPTEPLEPFRCWPYFRDLKRLAEKAEADGRIN